MLTIAIALLVCLLGAVIYLVAKNPKYAELGRIAFMVGLFWTVYHLGATRNAHLF